MLYNLQILRALAAYLVFLTHLGQYAGSILPRPDFLAFGAAGVVPVYWLVTGIIALLALAGLKPIGVMEFRLEYLIQSLLFVPFSRGGYIEPLVSVGWTLNYEMFFYAVFAGLLLVPVLAHRVTAAAGIFLGLALLGLLPVSGLYWTFYTKPIVLEFAAGIGLGYAYLRLPAPAPGFPVRRVAGVAFVAAGLLVLAGQVTAYVLGVEGELTGFARPLVWGSAASLVVGAMLLLERSGVTLRSRWLLSQGNASYSFYLVHNLMLHTTSKVVALLPVSGALRVGLIFLIAFTAAALAGEVLFRRVEAPLNAALRRRLDRRPSPRIRTRVLPAEAETGSAQESASRHRLRARPDRDTIGHGSRALTP